MMSVSRRDLLRWQFDLTWQLFEFHLDRLTPEDFLWEPAAHIWTVRPGFQPEAPWVPDWAETELDPIPVPTIAWLTWHIGWWWSVTLDHAQKRPPRAREAIGWPGDGPGSLRWLRDLRTEWLEVLARLTDADLDGVAPFPWPNSEQTVAHMVAWVNAELMKNASEIGQLRLLRAAG
ncbi:DinB family protein [Pendulispora rubella]|uniref:DinB family protein n=1 Tax=Pendulispora rubella TaxID=2741070 RepID=A0ABZ2L4A9_9BACT